MKIKRKQHKRTNIQLIVFFMFTSLFCLRIFEKVNISDVTLIGSQFIPADEIFKNSSLELPARLILINTKYSELNLKRNLALKNVSVRRLIFPFGLKIILEPRIPIAKAVKNVSTESKNGFVDKDGFFIPEKFAKVTKNQIFITTIYGWEEKHREIISRILKSNKNSNFEFTKITISKNGFLSIEDKFLKMILIGFEFNQIDTQLELISSIKMQLIKDQFTQEIDSIDLTDPTNPKIKVFKP